MKVAFLGLDGDFDKGIGEGTQRYVYELYRNVRRKLGNGARKASFPTLGSYLAGIAFEDFGRYDIVHIPKFRFGFPFRAGKAVTLTTEHDFQPIFAPELDADRSVGLKGWLHTRILREGLMRSLSSDYLIANSTLTRDDAVKLGYDKSRIYVVSHGLDSRFFTRPPEKRRETFTVGYLGAFRMRKNVKFAIDAFMAAEGKKMRMLLYGNSSYQFAELSKLAAKDRRIKFGGFAPEGGIVQTYDRFDAFVFPSLYEGFGFPILEAQARGLPVVIYKGGKIPAEVRKHCFVASSKEEMTGILEELAGNGYNEKERASAMRYARKFTWERCAGETMAVYGRIA